MSYCPDLPNEQRVLVNVSPNETPDSATLNRGSNRLLENDLKLKELVCKIFGTTIYPGLSGAIGEGLKIDNDYFQSLFNDFAISAAISGLYLNNLLDVDTVNPTSGQQLIYDGTKWTNGVPDIYAVSGAFLENTEYLGNLTNTSLSIEPLLPSSLLSGSYLYEYPLSAFTSTDGQVLPDKINGVIIEAHNFGRVDIDRSGIGGADWRTLVQYPDGNFYIINSHHAENIDDDGGSGGTTVIPVDPSVQTYIRVRCDMWNNDNTVTDSNGKPLNRFAIKSIGQRVEAIALTPELDITYVRGTVILNDPGVLLAGEIVSTTAATSPYKVWISTPTAQTFTGWSSVFPIAIPNRCSKTEIEFENYMALSGVLSSLDPGAEEGSLGLGRGSIFIDWLTKRVTGVCNYYAGPSLQYQGALVLNGGLNTPLQFTGLGGEFSGLDIRCGIHTGFRQIKSLPCMVNLTTGQIANNVSYTIRNYNVIGVDSLPRIETFVAYSTSNTVAHNLSKRPDMFQVTMPNGLPVHYYFRETPNGTDGGLKYRHAYASATSTHITANPNTASLPAGIRVFTGIVFPS